MTSDTMTAAALAGPRAEFFAGLRAVTPLIIGAVPFGIIFGAVAVAGGISPAAVLGLSAIVFAGSSQFIGANLYSTGVSLPLIALTTFIVNIRHALYGVTLAPHVRHLPLRWLLPLAFLMTDEAFAVAITRYNQPDDSPNKHWFFLGTGLGIYVNWQIATVIGVIAGGAIPNPAAWGLDFAIVVTFIGIVVPSITTRPVVAAVIASAVVAIIAYPLPNRLGLMAAALAGVAAGYLTETFSTRPQSVRPAPTPQQKG